MKKLGLLLTATAMLAFVGCKNEKKDTDSLEELTETVEVKEVKEAPKMLSVMMESKSGSNTIGEVVFTEENGVVKMEAKFEGLTEGTHAIHIHEKADCSADDGTSTGGHWNPTHQRHGKWGDAEGYHKGDIGNMVADANGMAKISMETDEWCIGCDDENKNIVGKAIIVHDGEDDFVSQPTGDAGGRVSCGGIIK
ncbi:superoxide dismutase family protein [Aequorivita sp. KMM 9714]|uniref:superoxide dismutase family protein n=1 Tax=Aequorivita sp. KMM 9714 TaxID=2707173 RepID=UPI0013EBA42A|nr:superoxide dismutase family protein [Aequorivita sp. KMM 9714]NGX84833.1 superoxide dismutase family protein [Aequorivita sp. KMM 9714]